jgi:hypothetical protein
MRRHLRLGNLQFPWGVHDKAETGMRKIVGRLGHALAVCLMLAPPGFAAGREPAAVPAYPGSVAGDEANPRVRLTRDGLEQVRAFYAAHLPAGYVLRPSGRPGSPGYEVTMTFSRNGRELTLPAVRLSPGSDPGYIRRVLGELKRLVRQGRGSEAEYRALEAQARDLEHRQYRWINQPDGSSLSEGAFIFDQAMQQARTAGNDPGGAGAPDAWKLWAGCLNRLREASFSTRLDYGFDPPAAPASGGAR